MLVLSAQRFKLIMKSVMISLFEESEFGALHDMGIKLQYINWKEMNMKCCIKYEKKKSLNPRLDGD